MSNQTLNRTNLGKTAIEKVKLILNFVEFALDCKPKNEKKLVKTEIKSYLSFNYLNYYSEMLIIGFPDIITQFNHS